MAKPRRSKKLYPRGSYVAPQPPPGLYDPALDAGQGASQRGYADFSADTSRDFGAGYSGGRTGHDYQLGLENLATQQARSAQDHTAALAGLDRNYQLLGGRQAEGQRAAGVAGNTGLAARAAQIRAANETRDRAPIDTAFTRGTEDNTRARGELGLGYTRAVEDAQTGMSRAGREATQFGVDTNISKVFQASQAGWDPGPSPAESAFNADQAAARTSQGQALSRARRRRGRGVLYGSAGRPSYGSSF